MMIPCLWSLLFGFDALTGVGWKGAPAAASFLVDIPRGLGNGIWRKRHLAETALRVAFADFSATPWRGLEKSERGPNNSSLFRPLAAVVVVAVRVLYRPPPDGSHPGRHSYALGTAHESKPHWGFDCPVCGVAVLFESCTVHQNKKTRLE